MAVDPKKTQAWKKMTQKINTLSDNNSLPIDKGIKDLVVTCNLLGLYTESSCEGHDNWGTGSPYVDFCSKNSQAYASQIEELTKKYNIAASDENRDKMFTSPEFTKIVKKRDEEEAKMCMKVLDYLNKFYTIRKRENDIFLQLSIQRLESSGTAKVGAMTSSEKKTFLKKAQSEFKEFTNFLINQL